MALSLADLAKDFAPKGSGGDIWSPVDGGPATRIRIYRVKKDGALTVLPFTEKQVWDDSVKKYLDPSPELEAKRQMLYSTGSAEDKKKANGLKVKTKAWLMIVLPDTPTGFMIWKAPQSVVQRIFCILASKANGGMPVAYSDDPEFYEAVEKGCEVVCGPKGWDLALSFNKKAGPAGMYDLTALDKPPQGFKVLPFSEDETPDPSETAARMKAARNKKEA